MDDDPDGKTTRGWIVLRRRRRRRRSLRPRNGKNQPGETNLENTIGYAEPTQANRVYPHGIGHTPEMIADLSRRAYEYRAQVLRMVYERKSGHIGGAFSIAEILTALYFHQLRMDPGNPRWPDRDRLVFSKDRESVREGRRG